MNNRDPHDDDARGQSRKKVKKFSVDLIPTLNRAIVMSAFISGKPLTFAVKYDKKSSALQFQLDSNSSLIRERDVRVQMYRNLDTCRFCRLFFDMETVSNDNCDYRGKFLGVKSLYARHMIQFLKEKYDYQVNDKGKPSQNYMLILGWKLQDSDNDLLFYFIQRKCYNDATRVNIVRTAGLQLATERGLQFLERYAGSAEAKIRKINELDDVPFFAGTNGNFEESVSEGSELIVPDGDVPEEDEE